MDKNRVKLDQLALLYLLLITGGKFLSLPSLLAGDVGHDSWLAMIFSFLWDGICLCFLLWAIKLNSKANMDISAILDKSVSKVVSKILLAIFFVIFMLRTMILMSSCFEMFSITFDVSTNWIVYVIPIAILSFFAIQKGFNAIARTSQLLFGLILLAVIALLASPFKEVQFTQLLPIGEAGWGKILATSYLRSFWFSDYMFIYFVLDGVKIKKRVFTPMLVCFGIGVVITVLLNAVFVALFGSYAPDFDMAMSKIGAFSAASSSNGRWDWLTLSVWLLSVFIKIIVFIFCAYKCIEKILDKSFANVNWIVALFIVATLMIPMFVSTEQLLSTVILWGVIPFTLVQYLLPLLMPLFTKVALNKTEVKHE
ncbi:MAG: GerAB/ArcD/ProY family transporter [Clostridiales bacterium]|nr:GerAB/ArcD/ProY family transporter [Clostridiales bacterium]